MIVFTKFYVFKKKKICIQLVRSMLEYLFWFSYQMEFAVNMTCEGCVKSVKNSLQGIEGIFTVTLWFLGGGAASN